MFMSLLMWEAYRSSQALGRLKACKAITLAGAITASEPTFLTCMSAGSLKATSEMRSFNLVETSTEMAEPHASMFCNLQVFWKIDISYTTKLLQVHIKLILR